MASTRSSISSASKTPRRSSASSVGASSSVSSTSCSLSSTGSVFQCNGGPEDRAKRVPVGKGGRQQFLFSRLGSMVDKDAKNPYGRRMLGIRLPHHDADKVVETKFMKSEELERVKPNEEVYYCAPKQLLYSKQTFKSKKAKARTTRPSPLPKENRATSIVDHPLKRAYIKHAYSVCRCLEGGREAILEIQLNSTFEALLPHGTWDEDDDWLSPDWASAIRLRDLATDQTKALDHPLNGSAIGLKRGDKLWYSPKMEQYFTERQVRANLKTEAEYKQFLSQPPKVHSH